jgi:hypothetical protein
MVKKFNTGIIVWKLGAVVEFSQTIYYPMNA